MFILLDDLSGEILDSVVEKIFGDVNRKELIYDLIERYEMTVGHTLCEETEYKFNCEIFKSPSSLDVLYFRNGPDLYTAVARCVIEYIYAKNNEIIFKDGLSLVSHAGIEI